MDVVRVLVFIDEDMADVPRHSFGGFRIGEQIDHGSLQVREIDAVCLLQGVLVAQIGVADFG